MISAVQAVMADKAPDTVKKPSKFTLPSFSNLLRRKTVKLKGLAAIGIATDGISVCRIVYEKNHPLLDVCEFKPCLQSERATALQDLIKTHGLGHVKCTTVQDPGFYTLHLVDGPNVQPAEMKAAIRWRIKDLIDYDISDAVYDIFNVPGRNLRGQGGRMMYAVVARATEIQQRVDLFKSAGLKLSVIDIPELAMRNIASLLPQNNEGVALLHFTQQSGLITLVNNSVLYVARNVNIGTRRLRNAQTKVTQDTSELTTASMSEFQNYVNNIVLEVERSLEYYDRHSSNPPISTLYVPPMDGEVPGLIKALSDNLSISIHVLDINSILNCAKNVGEHLQVRSLLTIGAALRHG